MAGELITTPLEELCEMIVDCPHSTPVWTQGGVIVLRNQNIRDGRLDLSNASYTDEEHFQDRIRRAEPTEGDLVITREAPMGEVCRIPADLRCCLGQRMVLLRPDCSQVDGRYLLLALQSRSVQAQIMWAEGTGSTVSNLRIPDLKKLKIPSPSLPEQRAIAHILGTLDDKIELNRRRNQTLEAMARALFKDWFVDFGPVRAKMEGSEPYLPADLWRLFPERLDDDGRPEGWEEVSAETVADIGIGKTPPRKEHQWFSTVDSDVRWVSIRDMGDSGLFLQKTSEYLTREAVEKFNVRVVPNNTVILSFKLTVGRVSITDGEMVTNEAIAHLKVGDQRRLSTEYLYGYLREFDYGRLGSTSSIATAVNSKSIRALPVLVPTHDLAGHFTRRIVPLFARIKQLQSEATTLAQLRDTLLPKLISGELRIADAERFIEDRAA